MVMPLLLKLLPDKDYSLEIKEYRKPRSLDANAYYWVLIGKYADWARVSKTKLHNQMLASYGQTLEVDGKTAYAVLPDSDAWMDLMTVHLKPTSQTTQDRAGNVLRTYKILRGSHEYDSMEMAVLIDGLIQEIQGSGSNIETLTPRELEQMKGYR